jgi:AcrR family transcriptional regulator
VPKDRGDVRRGMQVAAIELFMEKGYDGTTAAEIATRAGVTERTFFRYFPDKRDVLFDEAELHRRLNGAIVEAPLELGPLEVVSWAFQAIASLFEENRSLSEPGQKLIAQTPALQERQLTKTARITITIAEGLRRREVDPVIASLAAATGMAVAGHALQTWFQDSTVPLVDQFERAFQTLTQMVPAAPS